MKILNLATLTPVLALMGGADPGIPETEVRAFEKALNEAKVKNHVEIYAGARWEELVAQPRIGERATNHDLVVAAP